MALSFTYTFVFRNGRQKEFDLRLEEETLDMISEVEKPYPEWTVLGFHKCTNCPLDETRHKHCPVAVNLIGLVDFFKGSVSYEEADVCIESPERKYMKHTTLQQGISSLVGICMAASGCPVLEKLKPMVRFHLPFASNIETSYRVLTMYLLAQYFIHRRGGTADWDLKNLVGIYDDIRVVNKCFARRLSNIHVKDASLNALVKLDIFAMNIVSLVKRDMMDRLEFLFSTYLK